MASVIIEVFEGPAPSAEKGDAVGPSLFDLPDELFVGEAYFRVLQRPADPAGYLAYLRALRRGTSRVKILATMQASAEARAAVSKTDPKLSVDVRVWPASMPWIRRGSRRPSDGELLALEGSIFVDALVAFELDRAPSRQQREHWTAESNTLDGRRAILLQARQNTSWFRRKIKSWTDPMHWRRSPARLKTGFVEVAVPSKGTSTPQPYIPSELQHFVGTGLFTIATRSYLPYVRLLMRSVRTVHPDFHLICLLVDGDGPGPHEGDDWINVVAANLGIQQFDDMTWRYDALELCTALKPMFFKWLLANTKLENIFYTDPDIQFFSPMLRACALLEGGASMVLTPHITAPLEENGEPSTHAILKSGSFNLGFAAIRRDTDSGAFIDWWCERVRTEAVVDFAANLFTDQRWCDMAPSFVPGLAVLRDSVYNVAYWNLSQRSVRRDEKGNWTVDGAALVFFHFSGFNPLRPELISKHQSRLRWQDLGDIQSLFLDYADAIMNANWTQDRKLPYSYDFVDGVFISTTLRKLYRGLHPNTSEDSRVKILSSLLDHCAPEKPIHFPRLPELTPLMRQLHTLRSDLRANFYITDRRGVEEFLSWYWASGIVEHGLTSLSQRAKIRSDKASRLFNPPE